MGSIAMLSHNPRVVKGASKSRLLYMRIEANPKVVNPDSSSDLVFKFDLSPLEVVYNPPWVERVMSMVFRSRKDAVNLIAAAGSWTEQKRANLVAAMSDASYTEVSIRITSPRLLVPVDCTKASSPLLVADMSSFTFESQPPEHFHLRGKNVPANFQGAAEAFEGATEESRLLSVIQHNLSPGFRRGHRRVKSPTRAHPGITSPIAQKRGKPVGKDGISSFSSESLNSVASDADSGTAAGMGDSFLGQWYKRKGRLDELVESKLLCFGVSYCIWCGKIDGEYFLSQVPTCLICLFLL